MIWLQYVADMGSTVEQVEAASIRNSLRRMSHAILVLDDENGQVAAVLPEEEKEESEPAGPPAANDDNNRDDELHSQTSKRSFYSTLASLGNTFVIISIVVGYPVAVLPYYRADSTTE